MTLFAVYRAPLRAGDQLYLDLATGDDDGFWNETTGLNVRMTSTTSYGSQATTHTDAGQGLNRTEDVAGALATPV